MDTIYACAQDCANLSFRAAFGETSTVLGSRGARQATSKQGRGWSEAVGPFSKASASRNLKTCFELVCVTRGSGFTAREAPRSSSINTEFGLKTNVETLLKHGAKERLGCALTGHLQWLSR